jgi:hypothetical protein
MKRAFKILGAIAAIILCFEIQNVLGPLLQGVAVLIYRSGYGPLVTLGMIAALCVGCQIVERRKWRKRT